MVVCSVQGLEFFHRVKEVGFELVVGASGMRAHILLVVVLQGCISSF